MKHLTKVALTIIGYLFSALVIAFTAIQTYSLLYETTQSHLMAALGLVLFEGGMIYWWMVFQFDSEGIPQMAVALLVAILCLLLVVSATAIHLGATSITLLGDGTPARIITLAAIVHLLAKFTFPLLSPARTEEIMRRAAVGRITAHAFGKFNASVDELSDHLAAQMSAGYLQSLHTGIANAVQQHSAGHSERMGVIDMPSTLPMPSENTTPYKDGLPLQHKEELATTAGTSFPVAPHTNRTQEQ